MSQFNIHQAKAHFSELVQKALLGEDVIITKDNKPILRLVSLVPHATHSRRLGTAKGLIQLSPDFNDALEDFDKYKKCQY